MPASPPAPAPNTRDDLLQLARSWQESRILLSAL